MILKGRSTKGKERIRRFGNQWRKLEEVDTVLFSSQPGPWWFVEPVIDPEQGSRWIRSFDDPDFVVVA
jgi:hypothetical protein